jgi:UDP-3-O-[3-hydroxymyristoyl] glucosamine N-acyltransferase
MSFTVEAIAAWFSAEVVGDGARIIDKAQSLSKAGRRSVAFFSAERGGPGLVGSAAGAVFVGRQIASGLTADSDQPALILVDDPKRAFLEVAGRLHPRRSRPVVGISPQAFVGATARVGTETNVHPGAYVGAGATVGDRCEIHPGAVIGPGCRLGDDVVLHPNAVLYEDVRIGSRVIIHAGAIIGADGFGYRTVDGRHVRVPHFGIVRIEDDVEVGAATTIDRAMIDETVIGAGTKLDNLVMIGHNCEIGRHNLFVSQVGLAGSVTTGDYVVCAGQVGVADHVHLGAGCVLGAKSGVHKDIPGGQRYIGQPAIPESEARRVVMSQQKIPEMRKQLRVLEHQVEELIARLERLSPSVDPNSRKVA